MPAGVPSNSSVLNDCSPRMKLSTATARIIGDNTGRVMRQSIVAVLAPATRAASSKVAPNRRNTGTSNITLNHMPPVEVCTQTMPQKL